MVLVGNPVEGIHEELVVGRRGHGLSWGGPACGAACERWPLPSSDVNRNARRSRVRKKTQLDLANMRTLGELVARRFEAQPTPDDLLLLAELARQAGAFDGAVRWLDQLAEADRASPHAVRIRDLAESGSVIVAEVVYPAELGSVREE